MCPICPVFGSIRTQKILFETNSFVPLRGMASKNVSRIDVQTPVSFVPYTWQRTLFHRSLVFLEPFHFEIIQSQFFEDARSGREYFQK